MEIIHRVISLLDENKRRNDISNDFSKQNIPFVFFDAILGRDLDATMYENTSSKYHRKLTKGELGCYLSHISVIDDFVKSKADYLIVYEDDVKLCENYPLKLKKILESIDDSFLDILLLGYRNDYLSYWGELELDNIKLKRFCDYGWGAHGYLITKTAAKRLLHHFSDPLFPFDCITGGYSTRYSNLIDSDFRIYACPEKVVLLNEENSDITTIGGREQEYTDKKIGVSKLVARLIKSVKPIKRY